MAEDFSNACRKSDLGEVARLLEGKASPDSRDKVRNNLPKNTSRSSRFLSLSSVSCVDLHPFFLRVTLLLSLIGEQYGWTPLTLAAQNGHAPVVALLLAANASPNFLTEVMRSWRNDRAS